VINFVESSLSYELNNFVNKVLHQCKTNVMILLLLLLFFFPAQMQY